MANLNRAQLIGRLGKDPETRQASGSAVCNFSLATTMFWVDKQGQKQERTEWHRVVVWSKLAELCQQFIRKGSLVYVEGRLQTREWNDRDGNKRYTTEVVAEKVQFLDRNSEREVRDPNHSYHTPYGNGPMQVPEPTQGDYGDSLGEPSPNDHVPF